MYQFGGTYPVPDDIMPLSSLIAVNGQSRQNNDVWRALYDSIVDYKKIIMTSGNDATLAGNRQAIDIGPAQANGRRPKGERLASRHAFFAVQV